MLCSECFLLICQKSVLLTVLYSLFVVILHRVDEEQAYIAMKAKNKKGKAQFSDQIPQGYVFLFNQLGYDILWI